VGDAVVAAKETTVQDLLGGEKQYQVPLYQRTVWIGRGNERSCYLMAHLEGKGQWPVVFYATGKCEVVFQYMAARPPFDDIELRREFLNRLNKIAGVDLPDAKLELRPGFGVELLTDTASRETFVDALTWFFHQPNPSAAGSS
jgi:hypothetical protein